jgi:ribosomal protein S18
MHKRKDECLFCTSRSCYERVVSSEDGGQIYDEIACPRHQNELYKHSDEKAPKIMKHFISSTGKLRRGEPVNIW